MLWGRHNCLWDREENRLDVTCQIDKNPSHLTTHTFYLMLCLTFSLCRAVGRLKHRARISSGEDGGMAFCMCVVTINLDTLRVHMATSHLGDENGSCKQRGNSLRTALVPRMLSNLMQEYQRIQKCGKKAKVSHVSEVRFRWTECSLAPV